MELDCAIAAINDNQSLNSQDTIDILNEALSETSPENLTLDVLRDFFKIHALDSDSPHQKTSEDILELLDEEDLTFYEKYLVEIQEDGLEFVPFYDEAFPESLLQIQKPPLALFVDGDLDALSNGAAVVGTRDATDERLEFVKEIVAVLVDLDYVVVSGLANGVDEMAHRTAIESGGKTTAVLPGDVQTIRPASNRDLGKRIRENGALVGEQTTNKSIHRGRFVERNRVTSGMSSTVIIGASGETGGTIHQADFAKSQNKRRYIYDSPEDDGQTPNKVLDKGFVSFESPEELRELLKSEFSEAKANGDKTLDQF